MHNIYIITTQYLQNIMNQLDDSLTYILLAIYFLNNHLIGKEKLFVNMATGYC